ncbi:Acyl-CoA dehydrogenase domain protein, partial [Diplonema papillatum]
MCLRTCGPCETRCSGLWRKKCTRRRQSFSSFSPKGSRLRAPSRRAGHDRPAEASQRGGPLDTGAPEGHRRSRNAVSRLYLRERSARHHFMWSAARL